ncbi:hypothetical protein [Paraconexibacter algicola]|nr:hypothetical protein [Paraconexibacter algicola]
MDIPRLVETRTALHQLAEHVIAPLRVQETGNEIALTIIAGGFATPPLPAGGRVGVRGTSVLRADPDGTEHLAPIRTLGEAADHVGLRTLPVPDRELAVDPDAAALVHAAHAVGAGALTRLRAIATDDDDVSEVVLWPEHFDVAIELGPADRRATYGVSPGDENHPRPYAYVATWNAPPSGDMWNAVGFTGAQTEDLDEDALLAFWSAVRAAL